MPNELKSLMNVLALRANDEERDAVQSALNGSPGAMSGIIASLRALAGGGVNREGCRSTDAPLRTAYLLRLTSLAEGYLANRPVRGEAGAVPAQTSAVLASYWAALRDGRTPSTRDEGDLWSSLVRVAAVKFKRTREQPPPPHDSSQTVSDGALACSADTVGAEGADLPEATPAFARCFAEVCLQAMTLVGDEPDATRLCNIVTHLLKGYTAAEVAGLSGVTISRIVHARIRIIELVEKVLPSREDDHGRALASDPAE